MVAGQSLESHSLRVSLHAASPSLPLGPSAQLSSGPLCLHSHPTQPSSGPLSSALPPLQTLLCSPAALQPCHRVACRALVRALYIEPTAMYCPQVCSELVNQGQVRILATGTLILSTLGLTESIVNLPRAETHWQTPSLLQTTEGHLLDT